MSNSLLNYAWKVGCPSPTAKLVLVNICDRIGDKSGKCYPSLDTIARECGLSRKGVILQLQKLEALKLVAVERSAGRLTNCYTVPTVNAVHSSTVNGVPSNCERRGSNCERRGSNCERRSHKPREPREPGGEPASPPALPQSRYAHIPTWDEWRETCHLLGLPEWKARDVFLAQEAMEHPWSRARGNYRLFAERVRGWWQADGSPKDMPPGNGHPKPRNQPNHETKIPRYDEVYGRGNTTIAGTP